MSVRIDLPRLIEKLDERVARELPSSWPTDFRVRSESVGRHLPWAGDASQLEKLPRDVAISFLVDWLNEALSQYADGVSENAREPYGGFVTIDGDMLRVRFGRLPRCDPDRAWLAPELEPIPISEVVRGV
jgi:hypothetical protein